MEEQIITSESLVEEQENVQETVKDLGDESGKKKKVRKRKGRFLAAVIGFLIGVGLTVVLVSLVVLYANKTNKENIVKALIHKYYLSEVDEKVLEDGKYKGMISALEDPYSLYFTIDETTARVQSNEGVYKGIGVVLTENGETGILTVTRVYEGSPAETAGILAGDILHMVAGQLASDLGLTEAVNQIKTSGDAGIDLTFIREGQEEYVEVHVVPSDIEYQKVASQMINEEIGYLAIYDFVETTASQFESHLQNLKDQGMKKLIVDLRNNTGGLMTAVTAILDDILPEGVMVYTVDKNGNRKDYNSTGDDTLGIPMVVLVNEYTASASEIFAGAVRDYGLAELVGTVTYGKGVVQSTFFLEDGSAVKLTTANYYTPNGININDKGLEPDYEVQLDTEPDEDGYIYDTQLEKALEVIGQMN